MNVVRIAICQIETHPAVYLSHIAYLEEPFVPIARDVCLSHFATRGIEVHDIQQQCRDEYLRWAEQRLYAVLGELSRLTPPPGLVLFPETAIPIEHLPSLAKWSSENSAVILAGTHTPLSTTEAKKIYRQLGIDSGQVNQLTHKSRRSVLPQFVSGKLKLVQKKIFSPFEHNIVASSKEQGSLFRGRSLTCGSTEVSIVPLICSEALAAPHLKDAIDLIAIVSFDQRPSQFSAFCAQQVGNKRAVAFCNDAAFGGSRICVVDDKRSENWLAAAFPDGLAPGDGLIVADVDLDVSAVEVSTVQPGHALKLARLASIVSEQSPEGMLSAQLAEIERLKEPLGRAQELARLLSTPNMPALLRARLNQLYELERRGAPAGDWWPVIGRDCILRGVPSLRQLEAQLAATCSQHLVANISSVSKQGVDLSKNLVDFLAECQKRSGTAKALDKITVSAESRSTLDRDDAAVQIYRFLDNQRLRLLEISGLPQIGKSKTIEKALAQAGIEKTLRIGLNDSSSPDFVVYSIVRHGRAENKPPYSDPIAMLVSESVARAIRGTEVLIIEGAQELLSYGVWRDNRFGELIAGLVQLADREKVKVIIETQRDLPIDLLDTTVRTRLRVTGLQPPFAQALFDSQLRRVGLPPNVVTDDQRDFLVHKLGGHPIAIAIAADAIYESGPEDVIGHLKKRQGFFLNFLRALVERLRLSDEEQTILRILSLARMYVPREAVTEAAGFTAVRFIRNLSGLGAIEVGEYGAIQIAPILRDYFDPEELPKDVTHRFHKAAASAFLGLSKRDQTRPQFAVEADYHGRLAGTDAFILPELIDGALAVAKNRFAAQRYEEAFVVIEKLLQNKNRALEVVRLGAQIQARRNKFQQALELAKDAFARNRNDTWLLAELAKIALTLSRDDIAEQLISIAERAAVEDTSILIVKGRMALRRKRVDAAMDAFERAKQLTSRNAWPFFYLGRVYLQLGRIDDAIDVLFAGEEFVQDNHIRARRAINAIRTQLAFCYLYNNQIELAEPIITRLWEEERSPEVVRAYAALTIKKRGISQAHEALKELERAEIKSHYDRCQFHLLFGLFYLEIGEPSRAAAEFQLAHKADKTNVYVMLKLSKTLLTTANELWADGSDEHRPYVRDSAALVREILRIDSDNQEGLELAHELYTKFQVEIKTK